MGFKSINELVKDATGQERFHGKGFRSDTNPDGIVFATDIRNEKDKKTFSVRFRLGNDVVKGARLIPGDRVNLMIDKEGKQGLFARVSSGGWKLTKATKSANLLYLKISWSPGMPSIAKAANCTNITVDGSTIKFTFPPNTSFDEMARSQ